MSIFLFVLQQNNGMIVCTATLLFMLLFFAPFRVRIKMQVLFKKLAVYIKAESYRVPLFNETIALHGKYLLCNGTVDTEVDITQIDQKNGVDLMKCVTLEGVCVSIRNNLLNAPTSVILFENIVTACATKLACENLQCKIYSEVIGCLEESNMKVQIDLSANVAELSFCLIKQGVRLWMRKLVK